VFRPVFSALNRPVSYLPFATVYEMVARAPWILAPCLSVMKLREYFDTVRLFCPGYDVLPPIRLEYSFFYGLALISRQWMTTGTGKVLRIGLRLEL